MNLHLAGKRVVVTGGNCGIGFATALALAREGVDVVFAACDIRAVACVRVGYQVRDRPSRDRYLDEDRRRRINSQSRLTGGPYAKRHRHLGEFDIESAVGQPQPDLAGMPGQAFYDDDVNIKVVGYLRTVRAVAPYLADLGWDRIIDINGLVARQTRSIVRTIRNISVSALTRDLADELGPHGINVTVVHSGPTHTPAQTRKFEQRVEVVGTTVEGLDSTTMDDAIGRIVGAEEIGHVIAFLASPRSVSITGDSVVVGGGARGGIYY